MPYCAGSARLYGIFFTTQPSYTVIQHMTAPAKLCVFLLLCLVSSTSLANTAKFNYDKSQSKATVEVIYNLYRRHINNQSLNDDLSAEFLDNYLETLDPARMYLYSADVAKFQAHQNQFDDYFRSGNLDVAYEIYNIYHQRVLSRLETIIAQLEDESLVFEFTADENIQLDREDAEWPSTMAEANDLWFKRLKLGILNLKLAGKTVPEAREVVAKRYKNQLNRIQQEKNADVFETILNSLTVLYDPHTNYWSPKTSENFDINMKLSLEGIGAVLSTEDEFTKVVRLVPGGPAARQGQLKSTDRIVGVGQGEHGEVVDIVGWRLDEVVQLIRGPKNTVVTLEVLSGSDVPGSPTRSIKINRGKVKLEDQSAQRAIMELPLDGEVKKLGIIHLPNFYIDFEAANRRDPNYKSSHKDVARLIDELKAEQVDGLILDLRNNGGGSLQEATMLTDLFIDRGVVVQIKTPDGRVRRDNQAIMPPRYDGPLIVLINRLSASASEIFAGAIQDYGRGLVIGSQSFGKGTVQSLKDLSVGKLKLTESKFYRVSGESTQHRGVLPDIEFPSIVDKEDVGESAYETALPWDEIYPVQHIVYNDYSGLIPVLSARHKKRIEKDPDFIYLQDTIDLSAENQRIKEISLNEAARIARKEELEQRHFELENKRRLAKGLEPYENISAQREADEEESAEESSGVAKIDVDGDAILIEAGNVLIDMLELMPHTSQSHLAQNHNRRRSSGN
jgi:carboxyl-terminal processing protease